MREAAHASQLRRNFPDSPLLVGARGVLGLVHDRRVMTMQSACAARR
mgnify:CR=1 FL=1